VVPRAVDDWLGHVERLRREPEPNNPAWHILGGVAPNTPPPAISYSTLLNLAGIANTDDPARLWSYIRRYHPGSSPQHNPELDRLVNYACATWRDLIAPQRRFRAATPDEAAAMRELVRLLREREPEFMALPAGLPRESRIQDTVYDAGRREPFLMPTKDGRQGVGRAWFTALYEVLLGKSDGPRFGGTVAVVGIPETIAAIETALARTEQPAA
jgi:lysyl-tRNA synthetase class 1